MHTDFILLCHSLIVIIHGCYHNLIQNIGIHGNLRMMPFGFADSLVLLQDFSNNANAMLLLIFNNPICLRIGKCLFNYG